ncbi:MAG: hypothetical protein ACKOWF_15755, partial [Chloroflexota bacterium]
FPGGRRAIAAMMALAGAAMILAVAALVAGARSAPGGAADPAAVSPCEVMAAPADHCDWFGDNGMDLPREVAVPAAAPRAATCAGGETDGKRVQAVLFVPPGGLPARELERRVFQVQTALFGVDVIYQESGLKTGGPRSVRWVNGADCQPAVEVVEVPAEMLQRRQPDFGVLDLVWGAPNLRERLYLGFWTEGPSWGIADLTGDDRPGERSANWKGGRGGIVYGIPSAYVAAHELGHLLGAVAWSAPNASPAGHCTSLFDVMCYADAPGVRMDRDCGFSQFNRLDCGDDSYFASEPGGAYLPGHWNVADSPVLTAAALPMWCSDVRHEPDSWRSIYLNLKSGKRVFAAAVLPAGSSQSRAFCGPFDWAERARLSVREGRTYRIEVAGLEGVTKTLIRVWNPVTRRYIESNAGSPRPYTLTFTAAVDGPLGIEVINRTPGQGTDTPFTLSVVEETVRR